MKVPGSISLVLWVRGRRVSRPLAWAVWMWVSFTLAPQAVDAAVRNVGSGQPYATIMAALAASSDGDVINVVDPVHTEADIDVSDAVTIQGQGASATIVQAHPAFGIAAARVFTVASAGKVVIRDMTIRHGNETTVGNGGGIFLQNGALLLDRVVVTQNRDAGGPGDHTRWRYLRQHGSVAGSRLDDQRQRRRGG